MGSESISVDTPSVGTPSIALSGAGASETAASVFSFAPYWCYAQVWHCKHPDSTLEHSYVQFVGPVAADEVLRLYRERQMKGSNLVVGLTTDRIAGKDVPASFYRTLAYIFEVAKTNSMYQAVTPADLQRGHPLRDWCPPLWSQPSAMAEARTNISSSGAGASGGVGGPYREARTSNSSMHMDVAHRAAETTTAPASARLFSSAPFWCYLYSHEPTRAKKTPPKSSEQMLDIFRSGCLPDWTPVLGLEEEVSTFNSLPPSLFMTLGSLALQTASGQPLKPVGLQELTRWDKFIDSRTAAGTTHGAAAAAATAMAAAPPGIAAPGSTIAITPVMQPIPPQMQQQQLVGGMGFFPQPGFATGHFSQQPSMMAAMPRPVMWFTSQAYPSATMSVPGSATSGSPMHSYHPQLSPFSMSPAMQTAAGAQPPPPFGPPPPGSYMPKPLSLPLEVPMVRVGSTSDGATSPTARRTRPSMSTHKSQLPPAAPPSEPPRLSSASGMSTSSSTRMHQQQSQQQQQRPRAGSHVSLKESKGGSHQGGGRAAAGSLQSGSNVRSWETPLFRLFTADATRGQAEAAWWYLTAAADAMHSMVGPISCEQMILAYARGSLTDHHYVCGTVADLPSGVAPSKNLFESIGSLLQQVSQGGQYVLVSAQELCDPSNQRHGQRESGGGSHSLMSTHSMTSNGFHTMGAISDAGVSGTTSHAAAAAVVSTGQLGAGKMKMSS